MDTSDNDPVGLASGLAVSGPPPKHMELKVESVIPTCAQFHDQTGCTGDVDARLPLPRLAGSALSANHGKPSLEWSLDPPVPHYNKRRIDDATNTYQVTTKHAICVNIRTTLLEILPVVNGQVL